MRRRARQVYAHPACDFVLGGVDATSIPLRQSLTLSACALSGGWSALSRPERLRSGALVVSFELWHSLVVSARRGYLSALRPEPNVRACRLKPAANGQPGAKLMNFRPLHDRVGIRRIEGAEKTKGGIIIAD